MIDAYFEEDCFERRIWYSLDKDDNGHLSKEEFKNFCEQYLNNKNWKYHFEMFDKDKNNIITYDEFEQFIEIFYPKKEYNDLISEHVTLSENLGSISYSQIKFFLNQKSRSFRSDLKLTAKQEKLHFQFRLLLNAA